MSTTIKTLHVNGLAIDAQAIGIGLYDIICETGQEAIVAFGMIPKEIMDLAERLIREKVVAIWAKQLDCTVDEASPYIDEAKLKATVRPIVHAVSLGIYTAASNAGKMIV